jgi:hypothetical protein
MYHRKQSSFQAILISTFILSILSIPNGIHAQLDDYRIESFQDIYTELEEYQSVLILTGGGPLWIYEFELDFDFPFFDSTYDRMIYDHGAWGQFTDDEDEALLLMDYFTYLTHIAKDTFDIPSDVRFTHVQVENLQAFVLQYTKVYMATDPSVETHNSYLNFQLWFFENGVIEVHFGEMNLEHSPNYVPGEGFYRISGPGDTILLGPHMSISHPLDENYAIGLAGAYNDYEVVQDGSAILTVLPPEGWIIRFIPESVGVFDTKAEPIEISPNPTTTYIKMPDDAEKLMIADVTGRIVFEGDSKDERLDVSSLNPGIYFVRAIVDGQLRSGKFVKE